MSTSARDETAADVPVRDTTVPLPTLPAGLQPGSEPPPADLWTWALTVAAGCSPLFGFGDLSVSAGVWRVCFG